MRGSVDRGSAHRSVLLEQTQALVAHHRGRLESVARIPRERLVDERDHLDGEVGRDPGDGGRGLRRREDERFVVASTLVESLAREQRVEGRADAEDVGAAVDPVGEPHGLLWRHERGRAERRACAGAVGSGLVHSGDAEVEELHDAVAVEEQVRGLDVAVDDARQVVRVQDVERLRSEVERLGYRHLAATLLPELLERVALEQFHDEERLVTLRDVVVEHGDASGMLRLVRDVALAQEAIPDPYIASELGVEELERDAGAVAVGRGVHGGHTADAQQGFELVFPVDRRADARLRAGLFVRARGVRRWVRVRLFGRHPCVCSRSGG